MKYHQYFLKIVGPFLLIHVLVSLVIGYWDVRLSDHLIRSDQMSKIHYLRTLAVHTGLGIILGLVLSLIFSFLLGRRQARIVKVKLVMNQLFLALALWIFLILGTKIHLIWLETHITDPEGLLWTLGLLLFCILFFWMIRYLTFRMSNPHQSRVLAIVIILVVSSTFVDAFNQLFYSQPRKAKPEATNVLLIVIDTLRWDHVSGYGYPKKTTPSIDRLASEGVQYETAISTSPWTSPSHASIFTGQFPSKNGVDGRNIFLNTKPTTLAEVLKKNGYQTAGFVNNVYLRSQTGIARGFEQYEEFWGRNERSSLMLLYEFFQQHWKPREDTGAKQTRDAVGNWLKHDWNPRNPFFIFAHFMEPHALYGRPLDYFDAFVQPGVSKTEALKINQDPELYICGKLNMTDRDFEILNALYDNDIRYLDDLIGSLLQLLRSLNLTEKTLIILTADHGENFGEHNLMSHELTVYDTLLRVPLIMRFPHGLNAGLKIHQQVQNVDLFPSILSFLKIDRKGLDLQGSSLIPGELDAAKHFFAFAEYDNSRAVDKIQSKFGKSGLVPNPVYRRKKLRSVRTPTWKLHWGTDGTRELYAVGKDPYEKENLFTKFPGEAATLEKVLQDWSSSFTPSYYFRQEELSPEALRELRSLGYVQ